MSDETRYYAYCAWCEKRGLTPAPVEVWLKTQKTLLENAVAGSWYDR